MPIRKVTWSSEERSIILLILMAGELAKSLENSSHFEIGKHEMRKKQLME